MIRRDIQNMFHIAAAGISRPNRIATLRKRNLSRSFPQLHNHFRLGIKTVDVSRLMVLGVSDKSYALKPNRTHV